MIRGIPLRQWLGGLPVLFVLGAGEDVPALVVLVGLVGLLTITAVVRVLAWQRHTYEFTGGRIIERSGIVSRSERTLEIERIQQVDVERTLLDRLVGTCVLRLETAADSGEAELDLRVVSVEEARRLRGLLAQRVTATPAAGGPGGPGGPDGPPEDDLGVLVPEDTTEDRAGEEVLVAVPLRQVALAAVTGPRLLAVPAAIAVVLGVLAEYAAPDEIIDTASGTVSQLSTLAVAVLAVTALLGSIVAAAVVGLLRDGNFTIALRGSDLLVRRGLTTTRSATVPLSRVQRVTVKRRWLQDALGYASVTVHSAGGSGGQGGGTQLDRSLTVPLLPRDGVDALVHRLLAVGGTPPLQSHPPVARRRAVVRGVLGTVGLLVPLVAASIALDRLGLLWLALPIVAMGATGGLLAYRQLASGADPHAVAGRTGLFGSTTEISPLRKTQGTTVRSSWFQRRLGLASLAVHVAGPAGGITLQDLDQHGAERLAPTLHR